MKRKLGCLFLVLILVVLAIALFVFFRSDGPMDAVAVSGVDDLLSLVPDSATDILIAPAAAPAYAVVRANPLTSSLLNSWEEAPSLRWLPLALGRSPLVCWRNKSGDWTCAARPDPFRSRLLPILTRLAPRIPVSQSGGTLIIGNQAREQPASSPIDVSSLWSGLRGHLFYIQRPGRKAGFPPVGRPAVTAATIQPDMIALETRAAAEKVLKPLRREDLPAQPLFAGRVSEPPEIFRRIDRILPLETGPLLADGGLIVLYELDDSKLLPRPRGVVAVEDSPGLSDSLDRKISSIPTIEPPTTRVEGEVGIVSRRGAGFVIEWAKADGELILAFDSRSMAKYLAERSTRKPLGTPQPDIAWVVRFRPREILPALRSIEGNDAIKLLARDAHRAVERLYRDAKPFEKAGEVHMSLRQKGQLDELSVRVATSK